MLKMAYLLMALLISLFTIKVLGTSTEDPTHEWTKVIIGDHSGWINEMVMDPTGNKYVLGTFHGTADFDPSEGVDEHTELDAGHIFLTKYSSDDSYLWTKTFGGSDTTGTSSLLLDGNGNIYIVGFYSETVDFDAGAGVDEYTSNNGMQDAFITKYTTDGIYVWTKVFGEGTNTDGARSINIDSNGNYYIVGSFHYTVDFDPSEGVDEHTADDIEFGSFLSKYDSDDNYLWTKTWSYSNGHSILINSSNEIYVSGTVLETTDLDPGVGVDEHTLNGTGGMYLSKFDTDGNYIKAITFGSLGWTLETGLHLDGDDNILITGTYENTVDFDPSEGVDEHTSNGDTDIFVTKLNSDESYAWTNTIRGGYEYRSEHSWYVASDSSNNVYITGYYRGTTDFDPGDGVDEHAGTDTYCLFISKYDSSGNYVWTKTAAETAEGATGWAILLDSSDNIYLAGTIRYGPVDLDLGDGVDEHTASGTGFYPDPFIVKMSQVQPTTDPTTDPTSVTDPGDTDPNQRPGWAKRIMTGPTLVGVVTFISNVSSMHDDEKISVYIDETMHHNDLYIEFDKISFTDIINPIVNKDDVKFPWSQGFNTVTGIKEIEAFSSFNGFPVTQTDSPYMLVLNYDPAKLYGLDPSHLFIARYSVEKGKWEKLKTPMITSIENKTVATFTNQFGYFSLVYPASVWKR